jgi:hypothetical protein
MRTLRPLPEGGTGVDIAQGERQAVQRVVQLDLPVVIGERVRILYLQIDGTGVPVVKMETLVRLHSKDLGQGWLSHLRPALYCLRQYSIDAGFWQPVEAVTDSPSERFHLHLDTLHSGEHLLPQCGLR